MLSGCFNIPDTMVQGEYIIKILSIFVYFSCKGDGGRKEWSKKRRDSNDAWGSHL